ALAKQPWSRAESRVPPGDLPGVTLAFVAVLPRSARIPCRAFDAPPLGAAERRNVSGRTVRSRASATRPARPTWAAREETHARPGRTRAAFVQCQAAKKHSAPEVAPNAGKGHHPGHCHETRSWRVDVASGAATTTRPRRSQSPKQRGPISIAPADAGP